MGSVRTLLRTMLLAALGALAACTTPQQRAAHKEAEKARRELGKLERT